jgi:hypothetical protein
MTSFADIKAQCDWWATHFSHTSAGDNFNNVWGELEPGLQGASYCAGGVSIVFKHAGAPLPAIDRPYGFINCEDAHQWARRNGHWDGDGRYPAGSAVLFDWSGRGGAADHVGIVVADDGRNIHTFEFNTSPGSSGSQSNGDGAYYRIRPHGNTVLGAVRFDYLLNGKPNPKPVPQVLGRLPLTVDGVPGLQTYAALQRAVGAAVDGEPGMDTWKHVQARVGVAQDGDCGPITVRAIQKHVGAPQDGDLGPVTWRAIQAALNAKKF